jgi:hypothetical protein
MLEKASASLKKPSIQGRCDIKGNRREYRQVYHLIVTSMLQVLQFRQVENYIRDHSIKFLNHNFPDFRHSARRAMEPLDRAGDRLQNPALVENKISDHHLCEVKIDIADVHPVK